MVDRYKKQLKYNLIAVKLVIAAIISLIIWKVWVGFIKPTINEQRLSMALSNEAPTNNKLFTSLFLMRVVLLLGMLGIAGASWIAAHYNRAGEMRLLNIIFIGLIVVSLIQDYVTFRMFGDLEKISGSMVMYFGCLIHVYLITLQRKLVKKLRILNQTISTPTEKT